MKNKKVPANMDRSVLIRSIAYSKCEPQGGENMSAELDGCTVRLRRVVA